VETEDQGPGVPDRRPHHDEISLFELGAVLLRNRWVIARAILVGAVLGLLIAVFSGREYTATTSFLPHSGERGGLAGFSGLAQQFGFSIPGGGDAERSPEFYRDLITSREILDGVITGDPAGIDLIEHFEVEGDTQPERRERARTRLREEVLSVSVGRETGIVTVSVSTDRPELSAAMGERLLELISIFDVETRQSQASAQRQFAEERLAQLQDELAVAEDSLKSFLIENRQFSNSPQLQFEHDRLQRQVAMRQEVVTAMTQAYEQARIDEVRNTPVITVIENPEAPALPDSRSTLLKIALGLVLGGMFGVGHALVRAMNARAEAEGDESYREFRSAMQEARSDLPGPLRRSPRSHSDPD